MRLRPPPADALPIACCRTENDPWVSPLPESGRHNGEPHSYRDGPAQVVVHRSGDAGPCTQQAQRSRGVIECCSGHASVHGGKRLEILDHDRLAVCHGSPDTAPRPGDRPRIMAHTAGEDELGASPLTGLSPHCLAVGCGLPVIRGLVLRHCRRTNEPRLTMLARMLATTAPQSRMGSLPGPSGRSVDHPSSSCVGAVWCSTNLGRA